MTLPQSRPMSELERLMAKVIPEPNSGCWLWIGAMNPATGYGNFARSRRWINAHRASYEIHNGPIQNGLQLDHLCRVKLCVNPDHLEPVTCLENHLRGRIIEVTRARHAAKTHCKYGHPFSPENTRIEIVKGRRCRVCRTCNSAKQLRQRLNRKARKGVTHDV